MSAPRESRRRALPAAARPVCDAASATAALLVAIYIGSGRCAAIDPALLGYLGATVAATFAVSWRVSAFWRRPASAFYGRALRASLRDPRRALRTLAAAGSDLAAQGFVRRRGTARWAAHLLLSLGTLASFAVTLPLVFGWMRFAAEADGHYRLYVATLPAIAFAPEGAIGWLFFHALVLAAVAVVAGALYFVALRWRTRRLPGATSAFALGPLLLLLGVALTGLALPATRGYPAAFDAAALLHEVAVTALLAALAFSKLAHVLVRPLQLGARAVRGGDLPWRPCAGCGAPLAPSAQHSAVAEILAARGIELGSGLERCPACRRRATAAAQSSLVAGGLQPASASPARLPGPGGGVAPAEAA